ncbi:MAG: penicillin-binding protein 2 [Firmicutes bacterium]|nr:penicillin-binding protein 2 [Bacillota bacterium]
MPTDGISGFMKKRIAALFVVLAVALALVAVQIGRLQVVHGEKYDELSRGNRLRLVPVTAPRGIIYDRNGAVLAASRPAFTVSLFVMDPSATAVNAARLSAVLGMDAEKIRKKVSDQWDRLYEPIKIVRDISPDVYTAVEEHRAELPGVVVEVEPVRDYPNGTTAAHALGYVHEIMKEQLSSSKYKDYKMGDTIGQFGLEAAFESELRGQDGGKQVEVDARGRFSKVLGQIDPTPGNNVYLTLDLRLQSAAERALDSQIAQLRKTNPAVMSGAVVVLDVRNGEILAMASRPAFDPNDFSRGITPERLRELYSVKALNNLAIAGVYPPGSSFKMVTAMAALEEGKVTQTERIVDPGHHWLVPSLSCWNKSGHGAVDIRQALQVSCNVFFYEMGRRLGLDLIAKYGGLLGLGSVTGVEIPGEAGGLLPTSEWKRNAYQKKLVKEPEVLVAESMMAGMGQVFHSYTPLQMANYVATIANGGTRYRPHFLKAVVTQEGAIVREGVPEVVGTLGVSKQTLDVIREGMWLVTQPGGTAASVFSGFPVKVGAKTGTAENPHGADHAWFVAYAPFGSPEIAVAVIVEQGGHGGSGAGPIARRVLESYFNLSSAPDVGAGVTAPTPD